ALACTLFPQLPVRIIYVRNPDYWRSAPLVPWIAWAVLPLILANVLLNNLLARGRFRVVPWSLGVAVGYGITLFLLADRLTLFSNGDVRDPAGLARRLRTHADPIVAYVWERSSPETRQSLSDTSGSPSVLKLAAVQALNQSLRDPHLYQSDRFAAVRL